MVLKAMCIALRRLRRFCRVWPKRARLQRTKLAEFHAGVKTELPEDADEPPVLFSEREAQLLAERLRPIPTA